MMQIMVKLSEEEATYASDPLKPAPGTSMTINVRTTYIVCLLQVLPPLRAADPPCLAHEPST